MTVCELTSELDKALASLFPAGVAVASVEIATNSETAHPIEAIAVARAVPSRQAEFAAGRAAARACLRAVGHPATAIPSGPNRQPLWPQGLSGSIAHSTGVAIAALRRGPSLGVDIEPDQAVERDLWQIICRPDELANLPLADRGRYVRHVFCAKEAVYKAQFPATGALIGFDALSIRLTKSGFVAQFCQSVGGFAIGHEIAGRLVRAQNLILTGVAL